MINWAFAVFLMSSCLCCCCCWVYCGFVVVGLLVSLVRILQISQPLYTFLRFMRISLFSILYSTFLVWQFSPRCCCCSRVSLGAKTLVCFLVNFLVRGNGGVHGVFLYVFFFGLSTLDRDTFCCVCVACVWFIDFYICVYVYVFVFNTRGAGVQEAGRGVGP